MRRIEIGKSNLQKKVAFSSFGYWAFFNWNWNKWTLNRFKSYFYHHKY